MKIVVIDARGRGSIGGKVVSLTRARGHEVVTACPETRTDLHALAGLNHAFSGAEAVIDVTGPHSYCDPIDMNVVERSCFHIVSATAAAQVKHHIALSEVGTDRLHSAYFRAMRAREQAIESSLVPHTILRSSLFFEHVDRFDRYCIEGQQIHVAPARAQPVLSDEVAAALADLATSSARNSILEMGGPERIHLDELVRRLLRAKQDSRNVVTDAHAVYRGASVSDPDLMLDEQQAIIGVTRFEQWLSNYV